ncbi:DUF1120 domain-containing protein [Pseudomonas chlororaphis]|uniref:DUF1120 domain-containing protein n=1 Tax=Pseudomonas chlororaphis TaxID=587753 RepID=UPI00138A065E|nr:DUF1120 domain-containing protein [Pseudomonas chlororaphis]QQX56982.1 DUF1120 domain-containing protein [Pseudomonas chlororaphis subsp. aurantiaca]UVE43837.1 DUF1120 domain-containing protein [Pseudomonas chlororaphis]
MKRTISVGLLSAAMLASVNAHAAKAELKLIGTITPAACVPNFTGGATIDYGNIPAGTLNLTSQTTLLAKSTTFNVTCDAPTIFYLKPADERAATVSANVIPVGTETTPTARFGLGAAPGGENIGAYSLQITGETADSGTTGRIRSIDGGATWAVFGGILRATGGLVAFNNGSGNTPAPHTSITTNVTVNAVLAPANTLPLTDDIPLDGLATVEVVYP